MSKGDEDFLLVSCSDYPMSLVNAEMYAFMEWLPKSGYKHAQAPELEVYLAEEKGSVEFWMPIINAGV